MTIFRQITMMENEKVDASFLILEPAEDNRGGEVKITINEPNYSATGTFWIEDVIAALQVMTARRGKDIVIQHQELPRYEEEPEPPF